MIKVFFDTNIWIRLLVKDSPSINDCIELLHLVDQGKIAPYISAIVIMEVQFVLSSVYNVDKRQALDDCLSIIATRNMTVINKTDAKAALYLSKEKNVKYSDCLISTQIPKDTIFCTLDTEFKKFDHLLLHTPTTLLSMLKSKK